MKRVPMAGFVLCACCCALTAPAAGQIARGVVVDASGAPVRGAFVQILNEQGQQLTGVLAGEQGEFVLRMPAGRYSLRIDRIGHQTSTVPVFALAAQEVRTFRIELEVSALRLPELSVQTDNRCVGRPDGNRQTADVWAEARKALALTAWTESNAVATFRYRNYERALGLDLRDQRAPVTRTAARAGRNAYRSEHPDTLARRGYVRQRRGCSGPNCPQDLFGPDAELLLSDSFLDQHCFRLTRRGDRRGLLGLAFEPISGRRLPDIRGVLWLDERTAELRFIEYTFTNVENYEDDRYAGGRTEFRQLPNGAWIVSRWYIRAPTLARNASSNAVRVTGAQESGGEVLDVRVTGTGDVELVRRVTLEGIVFDSVRGRPLEGARVYLSGTSFAAMAGVAGRFRIDSVPAGIYEMAFAHPWLDSLPAFPPPVVFNTDSTRITELKLTVPSMPTLLEDICPAPLRQRFAQAAGDAHPDNQGVVFGTVGPLHEIALGAQVGIGWRRYATRTGADSGAPQDLLVRPHELSATVTEDGTYVICAVPLDHPLVIKLNMPPGKVQQRDSVRVMRPGLLRHNFVVTR